MCASVIPAFLPIGTSTSSVHVLIHHTHTREIVESLQTPNYELALVIPETQSLADTLQRETRISLLPYLQHVTRGDRKRCPCDSISRENGGATRQQRQQRRDTSGDGHACCSRLREQTRWGLRLEPAAASSRQDPFAKGESRVRFVVRAIPIYLRYIPGTVYPGTVIDCTGSTVAPNQTGVDGTRCLCCYVLRMDVIPDLGYEIEGA